MKKINIEKTLFISDLDGTLLTPDAILEKSDAERINRLSERGVKITYATARTVQSCKKILEDINFIQNSPPISLMNGVLMRDMAKRKYIESAKFSSETAALLLRRMIGCGSEPFIYTLVGGEELMTYYHEIKNEPMRKFMEERKVRYGKPFRRIKGIDGLDGDIIYFCLLGGEEEVLAADRATDGIEGIKKTRYRDSYEKDTWYIEIFDINASKKRAVEFLRAYTGAEYIVCFGDNLNDMPMFEASDFAVAVENAHPELKKTADDIAHNGVVSYIEEMVKKSDF